MKKSSRITINERQRTDKCFFYAVESHNFFSCFFLFSSLRKMTESTLPFRVDAVPKRATWFCSFIGFFCQFVFYIIFECFRFVNRLGIGSLRCLPPSARYLCWIFMCFCSGLAVFQFKLFGLSSSASLLRNDCEHHFECVTRIRHRVGKWIRFIEEKTTKCSTLVLVTSDWSSVRFSSNLFFFFYKFFCDYHNFSHENDA